MGIFNIFKKEVEIVEKTKAVVADEIIDYIIGFIKERESIRDQIKKINKIRSLPAEKRDAAYIPVYLSLERALLAKKPAATKEYFSKKTLRKQKEFTKEELRGFIREKFEIENLDDYFGVLFLDETRRKIVLYE